jgi:hypothetical protein
MVAARSDGVPEELVDDTDIDAHRSFQSLSSLAL